MLHALAPPHSYLMRKAIRWSSALIISAHHQRSSSALIISAHHQRSSSALIISAHHQRSSSALISLTSKEADELLRKLGLIVRVLIREPR